MAQEALYNIVQNIFSNWTGLKLAVEHSMGGTNSKQLAIDSIQEVTQFCMDNQNLDHDDLEDFLEDLMDEKFDTIFEDDSPKEIAVIIFKFVQLLKDNNMQQCEEEFQKLPTANINWLQQCRTSNPHKQQVSSMSSSESEEDDQDMPEEPMEDGWTVVQNRKKR